MSRYIIADTNGRKSFRRVSSPRDSPRMEKLGRDYQGTILEIEGNYLLFLQDNGVKLYVPRLRKGDCMTYYDDLKEMP